MDFLEKVASYEEAIVDALVYDEALEDAEKLAYEYLDEMDKEANALDRFVRGAAAAGKTTIQSTSGPIDITKATKRLGWNSQRIAGAPRRNMSGINELTNRRNLDPNLKTITRDTFKPFKGNTGLSKEMSLEGFHPHQNPGKSHWGIEWSQRAQSVAKRQGKPLSPYNVIKDDINATFPSRVEAGMRAQKAKGHKIFNRNFAMQG